MIQAAINVAIEIAVVCIVVSATAYGIWMISNIPVYPMI